MRALRHNVVRDVDVSSRFASQPTRLPPAAKILKNVWDRQKQPETGRCMRTAAAGAQSGSSLPRENMMSKLFEGFSGAGDEVQIHGSVLLQREITLAEIRDAVGELIGQNVRMQLVSTEELEEGSMEGKRSKTTHLKNWVAKSAELLVSDEGSSYPIQFSVSREFGIPGALLVENHHPHEFFLKSVTLHMPDSADIHFVCNSWVDNASKYPDPRIFFPNKVYLPSQTPSGIQALRLKELNNLKGQSNPTGERQTADRIYDYDVYNDLGDPDESEDLARPVLGGSTAYPYPRRCRTGRKKTKTDPASESPEALLKEIYIPRDEQFAHIKKADFFGSAIKSLAHYIVPAIEDRFANDTNFSSFQEISDLYTKGMNLSNCRKQTQEEKHRRFRDPFELIRELTDDNTEDPSLIKYPLPAIIRDAKPGLPSDDEFARETLAGINPLSIERLKVFPPVSSLDPNIYGHQASAMTPQHIENSLDGLTVLQALDEKRLFIVDYHDVYLPYLQRINALKGKKAYATRSLFFLKDNGTLKPICIEANLPPSTQGRPSVRKVFTPDGSLEWDLAKSHAIINDMGCHQLISHWLRTHCCVEPFIIAFHRTISSLHPLHVLLTPHFKNTMNINALARKILINCEGGALIGGIVEKTFAPSKYSMEMSSIAYKSWRFDEQSLPADLIKRGMAEVDPNAENRLNLFVKDYPYAVDGLQIWFAIEGWVSEYLAHYYVDDASVREDTELQSWWTEIKEVGHGDKRDESWWVSMETVKELQEVLVTLIWVASAHHAAVNFGQYAYAGYMPNRITTGRKLIPEKGTPEYEEMHKNPEKFYLEMVSSKPQATIGMTTIEILSQHASDEEYLGQRNTPSWTSDEAILDAFARFGQTLSQIGTQIKARNENPSLRNRVGSVCVPYTLLFPTSKEGMTAMGIPNSVSI